jgi:hypothetical protein
MNRRLLRRLLRMRQEVDEAISDVVGTEPGTEAQQHEREELQRRLDALRFYVDASIAEDDTS